MAPDAAAEVQYRCRRAQLEQGDHFIHFRASAFDPDGIEHVISKGFPERVVFMPIAHSPFAAYSQPPRLSEGAETMVQQLFRTLFDFRQLCDLGKVQPTIRDSPDSAAPSSNP